MIQRETLVEWEKIEKHYRRFFWMWIGIAAFDAGLAAWCYWTGSNLLAIIDAAFFGLSLGMLVANRWGRISFEHSRAVVIAYDGVIDQINTHWRSAFEQMAADAPLSPGEPTMWKPTTKH